MFESRANDFPAWYTPIKWLLPLLLSVLAAFSVYLFSIGNMSIPSNLVIFNNLLNGINALEGVSFALALSLSMAATFSLVGLVASVLVRGALLFSFLEAKATSFYHVKKRKAELENTVQQQGNENYELNIKLRDIVERDREQFNNHLQFLKGMVSKTNLKQLAKNKSKSDDEADDTPTPKPKKKRTARKA